MPQIALPHKVCPMTCMVNGLEDLYEARTGTRLPDWFLFYLSGMAGFSYIKYKDMRFVGWGTRPQDQYRVLGAAIGFRWEISEGKGYKTALKEVRAHIDAGTPVILGAVDMYHLPYFTKFYHQYHVPIHYILMVGYEDSGVWVHDCDRPMPQLVPYGDLQAAWDVHVPGLSQKNTHFAFYFDAQVADPLTIALRALAQKADWMLHPPVKMFGVPGIRKLARELPQWPRELSAQALESALRQMVEYTGNPPMLPKRLTGWDNESPDYTGGRQGFARLLTQLATTYALPAWDEAAALLAQSGQYIRAFSDELVNLLWQQNGSLTAAVALLLRIADTEAQAYQRLAKTLPQPA
ncbi:MAG: DUF4872 domain-containing protein [Chloroflexi bacterium]|nr:DUF4872 domain-containing protein [Chloroflexota bacterium]